MNKRIKFVRVASVLLTTAVLAFSTHESEAKSKIAQEVSGQKIERLIVAQFRSDFPVKITSVKTKQGAIETNKKFADNDDWIRGLTVGLSNQSGKSVTFVELLIICWRTKEQVPGRAAGWSLTSGIDPFEPEVSGRLQMQPVGPGGEIQLALTDAKYDEFKRFLKGFQFPDVIKKVELKLNAIGFDDDTAWFAGRMYRRDPSEIGGPGRIKGWAPIALLL